MCVLRRLEQLGRMRYERRQLQLSQPPAAATGAAARGGWVEWEWHIVEGLAIKRAHRDRCAKEGKTGSLKERQADRKSGRQKDRKTEEKTEKTNEQENEQRRERKNKARQK